MIEIRNAMQTDFDYITAHPLDERVSKDFLGLKISGWAKTALIDGEIIGIGGVVIFWKGVGEGWYVLSKAADNHKIQIINCIKRIIELAFKELGLHRLESTVRTDFDRAIELAEFLGFKFEGIMEQYTADRKDCIMYAIVKEKTDGS